MEDLRGADSDPDGFTVHYGKVQLYHFTLIHHLLGFFLTPLTIHLFNNLMKGSSVSVCFSDVYISLAFKKYLISYKIKLLGEALS